MSYFLPVIILLMAIISPMHAQEAVTNDLAPGTVLSNGVSMPGLASEISNSLTNWIDSTNERPMIFDLTNIKLDYTFSNRVISNWVILKGTNITLRVITNVFDTNTNFLEFSETNEGEFSNLIVTELFDPFDPLTNVFPAELEFGNIADLLFPMPQWSYTNRETTFRKKLRHRKGLDLISTNQLYAFSESSFRRFLEQRIFKRLKLTEEEAKHLTFGFEEWETRVTVQGTVQLQAGYGWIWKDESYPGNVPGISTGFNISQKLRVNVTGKIGDRISIMIDHSSDSPDSTYEIGYKALQEDVGILRELKFGNVDLSLPTSSAYIRYNGSSLDSYGLKTTLGIGDLTLQGVFNLIKSKKGYKKFTGKKRFETVNVYDVSYIKRKYFQLPDTGIDQTSLELLLQIADPVFADRTIDGLYFRRLVPGQDYSFNSYTGEIQMTSSVDRNVSLAAGYSLHGTRFSTNGVDTNFVGVEKGGTNTWMYLWRPGQDYSPFSENGWYALGYQNFDPTRGFSLTVYNTADTTSLSTLQFNSSDYDVNPLTGLIRFRKNLPFTGAAIYTNSQDPSGSDSSYLMKIQFFYPVNSYQLDFDVVPSSEQIYVNGRLLSPSEYYILHATGEIFFNNASLINENDTIEAYYEYRPFFSGSQKYGLALRLDWKPTSLFNTGGTFIYNLSQRDSGAPAITSTPDSLILANADANMNIGKLMGIPEDIASWTARGEAAVSVDDRNTVGYAIVDDFESVGDIFSFSKNETRWVPAAPAAGDSRMSLSNRGNLLFRDYLNADNILQSYNYALSTNKMLPYTYKCGPYLTFGGHLSSALFPNVRQTSLIFDYDFAGKGDDAWVGAAYSIAGESGFDLSEYNSLSIWARVQSDEDGDGKYTDDASSAVELTVAVGRQNEDADGNGQLEKELDRTQAGYPFFAPGDTNTVETWVGRGRLGGGDGVIQSEDLNRNGVLDTNGSLALFPSPGGSMTDLTNAVVTGGEWRKIEINVKTLSSAEFDVLGHASSITVYVRKKNGTKGRVIIDTIDFKKVTWKNKRVDGVFYDASQAVRGEPITIVNDTNYAKNRFYDPSSTDEATRDRAVIFEKLHGTRTISEANQYNEKSLAIYYRLTNSALDTNSVPATGGKSAGLIRRSTTSYDISRYNYLNFFVYVPSKNEDGTPVKKPGDSYDNENFRFVLGSTERSAYNWIVPMTNLTRDTWHQLTIVLIDDLAMEIDGKRVEGSVYPVRQNYPNLQDISFMELRMETSDDTEPVNDGVIWVNEIYASSSRTGVGTAWFVETSFEFKKPLLKTGAMEWIGPLTFRARYENKGWGFNPNSSGTAGNYNQNYNLNLENSLFRDLYWKVSWSENWTGTSTNQLDVPLYLQQQAEGNSFNGSLNWKGRDWIPEIGHSYTETYNSATTRNLWTLQSNDEILGSLNQNYSGQSTFSYSHSLPILKNVNITPEASFEDFYSLYDQSSYTNDNLPEYITNSSSVGMENLRKTLHTKLKFFFWQVNLSGGYDRSLEQFDPVYNLNGYRAQMDAILSKSIAERYAERTVSAFNGFAFPGMPLVKQNGETYTVSAGADRPVTWLSVTVNDTLNRTASGYSYDTNRVLQQKSELYSLNGATVINLLPKWWIIDNVRFDIKRKLDYTYYSATKNLEVTNIVEQFGEVFYQPFWQYHPLFNWDSGRTNSLSLVKRFGLIDFQNRNDLTETFRVSLSLMEIKDFWKYFIPGQYEFFTVMNTSRNQTTYAQNIQTGFNTSLPLRISGLFASLIQSNTNGLRWDDVQLTFSYQNTSDFTSRKILDTMTAGLFNNLAITREINLSVSYNFSLNMNNYLTNQVDWESLWGFTPISSTATPNRIINQSGVMTLNWAVPRMKELNLFFFKLNLRGSTLENTETLTVSGDTWLQDGFRFDRFQQKILEMTIDHSSRYKFTDYITGSFLMKGVINQYADVYPIGDKVVAKFFKPGFGFQTSVDVNFTF